MTFSNLSRKGGIVYVSGRPIQNDIARRIRVEERIVTKTIKTLLAAGFSLDVNDGENVVLEECSNAQRVFNAMFSTDEDWLIVRNPNGSRRGFVRFIYGNDGNDVISDYSTTLESVLEPVNTFAETL